VDIDVKEEFHFLRRVLESGVIMDDTSRGNYNVYSSKGGNYYFIGMFNRRLVGHIALDPNDMDIFQVTFRSSIFSELFGSLRSL